MAKFQPPAQLDFSHPEEWDHWKRRFTRFRIATKLADEDPPIQVNTLLYALGPHADDVFDRELEFSDPADKDDYDKVVKAFDAYFTPSVNVIHERTLFARLRQTPGESLTSFSSRLHAAADRCQFDKKDERIRDHLVAHMTDSDVSKDLQLQDSAKLKLADVLAKGRQQESLTSQLATQRPGISVHAASRVRPTPSPRTNSAKSPFADSSQASCAGCGGHDGHFRRDCPAWDQECRNCGRSGHFVRVCRSTQTSSTSRKSHAPRTPSAHQSPATSVRPVPRPRKRRGVSEVHVSATQPPDSLFMGCASSVHAATSPATIQDSTKAWTTTIPVNGMPVSFKLDSGVDSSILSLASYAKLHPQPVLSPSELQLQGPSGDPLPLRGSFVASSTWQGRDITFHLYVVDGPSNLLSRSVCENLNLLSCSVAEASAGPPPLGCMTGPPVTIELTPEARPYHCMTARRVPAHLQDKVKAELDRMVDMGVISPVTSPTDWCAPMVTVTKPNGKVRICVDLKHLNSSVKRSHFMLPTIEDTLSKLAGAKVFSSLDCASGFWQIPLDPASAHLTTFLTPFGRFHFNRLPFGITSAPEVFQQRLYSILGDIPNVVIYMDDILVFAATQAGHDAALAAVKTALANAGVQLNPEKCLISVPKTKFLGHIVSADGISPDPRKLEALAALPAPTDVTELRRALGMFTFLSKFLPEMASVSAPLRLLLKADSAWQWTDVQQAAFDSLKQLASAAPCLALYDPAQPCKVSADASSYGLGAVLLQPQGSTWIPVACASRSLTTAETRYAQIEKECLASVWACEHFHHHLYGGPEFTIETDHKPLVPLINSADLDRTPLRCQRLLLRLMKYNGKAVYVPGKLLTIADTLSRAPVSAAQPSPDLQDDVSAHVAAVTQHTSQTVDPAALRQSTAADPVLPRLHEYILHGWPSKPSSIPEDLRPYFAVRAQLSMADGLIYCGNRVVVPESCRPAMLTTLHIGHQGITKCRARARNSFWWPSLSQEIATHVMACPTCAKFRSQPAEPLQPTEFPSLPWEKIACDLCQHKSTDYLITVDYFSRYISVHRLPNSTTSAAVIKELDTLFATHGIPTTLISDNGPQFASKEFAAFANRSGFAHRTSSPRFAQSNGEAERAVQTAKSLIRSNPDGLNAALLAYRSTPLANGYAPSELLFGRKLRTQLPMPPAQPSWPDLSALRQKELESRDRMKANFDRRHRTRPLTILPPGQPVYIPDLDDYANVTKQQSERSYIVSTSTGSTVRRNRRALRSVPASSQSEPAGQPLQPTEEPTLYEVAYGAPPQPPVLMPPTPPSVPSFETAPVPPVSPARLRRPQPPVVRPRSSRPRRPPTRYDD